jgi:ribose-phosphate pyrophosphokinase
MTAETGAEWADLILFSGTAHPDLAAAVSQALGMRLGACAVERHPDGEVSVRLDEPVRRREVFLLQPTSPPVNEHLVELLAFADACRRASAASISAIIPYFGYARADKRQGRRQPIMASVVARLLQAVGIGHVVTVDLHAPQIEGFFDLPVDCLTAVPSLCDVLRPRLPPGVVVVSPDAGRVKMASEYARRLGTSVIVLHKQRESGTETEVTHVVGDVRGRPCLIIDDVISTGGTLAESIRALLEAGARREITVAATHGLFRLGARETLGHDSVREIWVTDTVPVTERDWPLLRVVSVAPLIAAALRQFAADGSLRDLY